MTVLSMSKQEFSRLDVLQRVQSGRLRVADACALMGLQRRQVFRLLCGLRQDSAPSLVSKRRGKPSNHRLPPEVRALALSIVRERWYMDFGPTFAAEKLAEHHSCSGLHSSARGRAIIGDFGSRSVRLSGAAGARCVILGASYVRRTRDHRRRRTLYETDRWADRAGKRGVPSLTPAGRRRAFAR